MTTAGPQERPSGSETVVFPFGEPDARLEDFLDDKLQSAADLETVDTLLAAAAEQQVVLQTQLEAAAEDIQTARGAAAAQEAALDLQLDEFAALEAAVHGRLAAVRSSDAPEAVVQRLQGPLQQLKRVSTALQYLGLLADVAGWAAAARAALPADPRAALEPYGRIRQLARELNGDEAGTESNSTASLHLSSHVTRMADELWADMERTMRAEMEAVLDARGWPRVDAAVRADETWRAVFARLVDLQAPEILQRAAAGPSATSAAPLVLLPVDVMAQIFVKEFRYHFLSNRRTADPRQTAEVCFPWVLERVSTWADFLRRSFADLLAARFAGTVVDAADAATTTLYVDPACAFVAALLPALRDKVAETTAWAVQQQEQKQPQQDDGAALCNFVVQLHALDDALRTRFGYDGGWAPGGWPGLAAAVLEQHFARWLQAEKDRALARYRDVVESAEGRAIDYDYLSGRGTHRRAAPTLAAVRMVDLLRAVTEQYRGVRRLAHRLRFLVDVQATLLDAYDDRLRGALEAYAAMTSAVGRTLHGVTREQRAALEGTGALETLCRVYGSADHVVHMLEEWGDEEFFVRLWTELKTHAAAGDAPERALTHEGGALFDEEVAAFRQRRQAALDFVVSALAESHRRAFRPYVLRTQWTTVAEGAVDPAELAITAELDEPLRIIQRNFDFLARALGTATLRRVVRVALEKLQDLLWSELLIAQTFSALGAAQLARDVAAIAAVAEQHVPRTSVAAALEGLHEGLRLLNLPATVATGDALTLQAATDRVFVDNAEAKKVLLELGLATLTPANARLILQRRVENAS